MEHGEKNLDLKGLRTFDKHLKMFELWRKLKEGEALRVIDDKEPKLLRKELEDEHIGQFEWDYEKEGPEEWVFLIRKKPGVPKDEKKKEIKELIKQLRTKEDAVELEDRAKKLLKNISPAELALIEQEMVEEGTTRKEMRTLCDVHLEVVKDSMGKIEMDLKPGHPVHTLMEEHKLILGFIDKLSEAAGRLDSAEDYEGAAGDIEILEKMAGHLVEADRHHKREEDVLFPAVASSGIVEPIEIMKEEHEELKAEKRHLTRVLEERESLPYPQFVQKVKALVKFISKELPDHICKEDNILYPIAVQLVPEEKWAQIKEECDEVGYCDFTPES